MLRLGRVLQEITGFVRVCQGLAECGRVWKGLAVFGMIWQALAGQEKKGQIREDVRLYIRPSKSQFGIISKCHIFYTNQIGGENKFITKSASFLEEQNLQQHIVSDKIQQNIIKIIKIPLCYERVQPVGLISLSCNWVILYNEIEQM